MKSKRPVFAWRATVIFYLVLLFIISFLDWMHQLFTLSYWGVQVALITLGIAVLVLIGRKFPDLSARRGVLLAFSIGVLTIIPGVMMSLAPPRGFWEQYFTVGLSMAAGSFLGFLFIKVYAKMTDKE